MQAAADMVASGQQSGDLIREGMLRELASANLGQVDYVSVAHAETLDELDVVDRPALASLAVRFPSARLIDCLPLYPQDG